MESIHKIPSISKLSGPWYLMYTTITQHAFKAVLICICCIGMLYHHKAYLPCLCLAILIHHTPLYVIPSLASPKVILWRLENFELMVVTYADQSIYFIAPGPGYSFFTASSWIKLLKKDHRRITRAILSTPDLWHDRLWAAVLSLGPISTIHSFQSPNLSSCNLRLHIKNLHLICWNTHTGCRCLCQHGSKSYYAFDQGVFEIPLRTYSSLIAYDISQSTTNYHDR